MMTDLDELHLDTFSIGDVTKATGLSRASLVKLEKVGLLKPYHIDERNGYRSYTLFEIATVLQYKLLRDMELSQDEILDYFTNRAHLDRIIEKMKIRKNLMQRAIEELEIRKKTDEENSFSFIDLPDVRCYCGKSQFVTPSDVEKYTAKLVEEAVSLGFTRLSYEPVFSMRWDTDTTPVGNADKPFEAMVCIPIESGRESEDDLPDGRIGHIEDIRGGRAFSLLHHGGYQAPDYYNHEFAALWDEIKNRQLKIKGPVRGIGIVCSYVGLDIDPNDYVFRFAVLVEE